MSKQCACRGDEAKIPLTQKTQILIVQPWTSNVDKKGMDLDVYNKFFEIVGIF
jgi:hypothetical protein